MFLRTQQTCSVQRGTLSRRQVFQAAFTLVELLVIVAIVGLAFVMMPVSFSGGREKARRIKCVSNLKLVALSMQVYAANNKHLFPWESANLSAQIKVDLAKDPYTSFIILTNELGTPRLLTCPADSRHVVDDWTKLTRNNISYFISPSATEGYPQSFLGGDRDVTTNGIRLNPGLHSLDWPSDIGWDNTQHKSTGNACLSDGSIHQLSKSRFKDQFKNSGLTNITLAIP
jgi:type II secretory pathway pseudopilin PulG